VLRIRRKQPSNLRWVYDTLTHVKDYPLCTLRSIPAGLAEMGYFTRKGKLLSAAQVKRLLEAKADFRTE